MLKRLLGRDRAPGPVPLELEYAELRSGFSAAVSHELRTPLARMLALLENALLPGADVPTLIGQARLEVREAVELIDEVLFLSELEQGREAVARGSTRLAGVAAKILSGLRDEAERADVELRADVPRDFELPLRRRLVEVVVANLAENAIRHAGPGAVFTLAARREERRQVLDATDTGMGVSRRDLPRLFERFYRADAARSSAGTGLGLAVVKHVVAAVGGSVAAEQRSGGGLTVRCSFPV